VLAQLKEPDAFLAKVRELYAQPEAESFDVLEFKDGRVFERYSKPQRISGELAGRVWSFRDVTERRRADEHAREVERLKTLDKFKTAFINMAAHELGTPLTPIKVQVHMLKRSAATGRTERVAHDLELLERNVNRLVKLVGDVLDGARAQASQLKITRSRVDLSDIMLDAVESYLRPAEEADLRIEVEPCGDLPVEADAARISQVLYNFLSNATKFTPAGGCVRVASERVGDRAVVRVTDTGPGLSAWQLERLFQPFSQVHDPQQVTAAGTGLGLYISRSIVEQHGGRIWAESDGPELGATFCLELPLIAAAAPVAAERGAALPTR
jgi:signal transduction histidine kinase